MGGTAWGGWFPGLKLGVPLRDLVELQERLAALEERMGGAGK
jgi:hypothetical protein